MEGRAGSVTTSKMKIRFENSVPAHTLVRSSV
jgi:hypothetical protein